jgi:hypothetical protein
MKTYDVPWFVAKDQGAYIGAVKHADNRILFYFKGCDPNSPFDEWYNNCRKQFGGDDFGEHLPGDWLDHLARDETINAITVIVEPNRISAEFKRS